MIKIKLDLPFRIRERDINPITKKQFEPADLFRLLISEAVNATFTTESNRGNFISNMTRADGKIWGKIVDKLDNSEDTGNPEIELSEEQFEFLRDKVALNDNIKLMPGNQASFNVISEYFRTFDKKDEGEEKDEK